MFPGMESSTFQPKLKELKNHPEKISYTSENGNPEKMSHIFSKENFMYFRKQKTRKIFLCFRKRKFLIFQEAT